MASIKKISGSVSSVKSSSILLAADEKHLFEAINWSTKVTAGADIVTWRLKDTSKKKVLKIIKENALKEESVGVQINKKYAGYTYYLEAELMSTGEKAGTYIYGFCDKKINSSSWSKTEGGPSIKNKSNSNPISFGDVVYLNLKTEGLNGSDVSIEIYNQEKGSDNKIQTFRANVTNGEVNLKIRNTYVWRSKIDWWVSDIEQFYIKVKDNTGKYVFDNLGDDLHAIYLNIEDKISSKNAGASENLTPTKIGEPDVNITPVGIIELIKAEVKTDFVVCNDSYVDNNDVWMLEHGGSMSYHWLKNRLRIVNPDNNKKPAVIPIIVKNDSPFQVIATFNTIISADGIKIRVRDKDSNYLFPAPVSHIKMPKDQEFSLSFSSTNTPFVNTIEYNKDFKLIFEYSFDEKIWLLLGEVPFGLHIPWKDPSITYTKLDVSVQLPISGKKAFRETLIWLGCRHAKGLGNDTALTTDKNEESILDAVFNPFKSLKILRRREGQQRQDGTDYLIKNFPTNGMGYWRGESLPASSTGLFNTLRSLNFLLSQGEARCGEWTTFFQNILISQGIDVGNDTVAICTVAAIFYGFPYSQKTTKFKYTDGSYQFAVKNAIHTDVSNPDITSGDSPGQGTSKSMPLFIDHFWFYYIKQGRFFDASYGKLYNAAQSNLTHYCTDNLNSVFLEENTISGSTATPTGVTKIKTNNLQDFILSDRALF